MNSGLTKPLKSYFHFALLFSTRSSGVMLIMEHKEMLIITQRHHLATKNGAQEQSLANKSMVKAKLKKLKLLVISKCEIEKQTFFK